MKLLNTDLLLRKDNRDHNLNQIQVEKKEENKRKKRNKRNKRNKRSLKKINTKSIENIVDLDQNLLLDQDQIEIVLQV